MKLKERAAQLKTDIPAVFLALRDKQTPFWAKLMAGLTVAYALSPVDIIPDFIPVLGYLDDLIILPALVAATIKLIPAETMQRCREKSVGLWENGRPVKWYYAVPIVVFWLFIIFIIAKAIFFEK